MTKTALDKRMGAEGWIKYTHITKSITSLLNIEDSDLMDKIAGSGMSYRIEHDIELQDESMNSLYVKSGDFEKVRALFQ